MGYYVMVDKPYFVRRGDRRRPLHTNRPRKEHDTIDSARAEAQRLAGIQPYRVVILEAVEAIASTHSSERADASAPEGATR